MMTIRSADERGHANHGWLDTHHTFSFADYHDPRWMGFRVLRVLNEDRVQPGAGFPPHGHRDMEILTYVLDGALAHEDSSGGGGVIRPGDMQRMSAGTGVRHSEFNASDREPVHFLQIWILPARRGIAPGYEQHTYPLAERRGRLRLVAAPDGSAGACTIAQDAWVYATVLEAGETVAHALQDGRHAWVHMARGTATLNGTPLADGDGAALSDEPRVTIVGRGPAELLLFDLP
jgi:redox-sensitive bicupin YhaK (pirin superfamily)